jgi:integrase
MTTVDANRVALDAAGDATNPGTGSRASGHICTDWTTVAIAAGDVKMLQSMLGHASAVMTLDRYGHLMPGRAEDIADRLDVLARAAVSEPVPAAAPLNPRTRFH